jgi:hypothetical protein
LTRARTNTPAEPAADAGKRRKNHDRKHGQLDAGPRHQDQRARELDAGLQADHEDDADDRLQAGDVIRDARKQLPCSSILEELVVQPQQVREDALAKVGDDTFTDPVHHVGAQCRRGGEDGDEQDNARGQRAERGFRCRPGEPIDELAEELRHRQQARRGREEGPHSGGNPPRVAAEAEHQLGTRPRAAGSRAG